MRREHEWWADLDRDLLMVSQHDSTRISGKDSSINVYPHARSMLYRQSCHPCTGKRLSPDIKEVTELRSKGCGRLDVNDAVNVMRVKPVNTPV